jgi:hypothetical protein
VSGASQTVASASTVGTSSAASVATCGTGKLLGGGATVTQGGSQRGAISISAPNATSGTPTGWTATVVTTTTGTGAVSIVAYAICGQ